MAIDSLALHWRFLLVAVRSTGQRAQREPEGTKSCRIQWESLSVRLAITLGLSEASLGLSEVSPGLSETSPGLLMTQASLKPALDFQRPAQGGEGTDGQMDIHMDGRIYRFPLYSTGLCPLWFPPGPLPQKGKV